MELDHVVIAAADLEAAAEILEKRYGLKSVEGGRHPDWGTANRIVPLGGSYLELVAVVDGRQAAESTFGRWVLGGGAQKPKPLRPLGWAVRPPDLDAAAARLDLTIDPGSRRTPLGRLLRWRAAGVEEATASPMLPFFIAWERETDFPGRVGGDDQPTRLAVARLELRGDSERLRAWLGDHGLPISVRAGTPALESVVLEDSTRQIVVQAY